MASSSLTPMPMLNPNHAADSGPSSPKLGHAIGSNSHHHHHHKFPGSQSVKGHVLSASEAPHPFDETVSVETIAPPHHPILSKPAWRKPMDGGLKSPLPELVMGASSWPALSDARSSKSTQTTTADQDRQIQMSEIESSLQGAGQKEMDNHSGNACLPTAYTLHSEVESDVPSGAKVASIIGSDSDRRFNHEHGELFRHRRDKTSPISNYNANRRNNLWEHGRGNPVWHHTRVYANTRDNGMPIQQQHIGPHNLQPPPAPYMGTNLGSISVPSFLMASGPGRSMYFGRAPSDHLYGTAYFAPAGQQILLPRPDLTAELQAKLAKQIEYYFSIENLCKDLYLRSFMDEQGFVPVSVIGSFNRVKQLTLNLDLILDALHDSKVIEVQGDKLRRRGDWMTWILPVNNCASGASPVAVAVEQDAISLFEHSRLKEVEHLHGKEEIYSSEEAFQQEEIF